MSETFPSKAYRKLCIENKDGLPISRYFWAYLAGLIDGDGSIMMRRITKGGRIFKVEVLVSNTSENLLRWLARETGLGSIHATVDRWHGDGYIRKPIYKWVITTAQAGYLLEHILPYLSLKKALAVKALEFRGKKNRDASWHEAFVEEFREIKKELQPSRAPMFPSLDQLIEMLEERGYEHGLMWEMYGPRPDSETRYRVEIRSRLGWEKIEGPDPATALLKAYLEVVKKE